MGRDCSPSPPSSTPPHCSLAPSAVELINNKIAASESVSSLTSHHHACSNPTKPLAFPGSPSPCAPCATLLLSESWACGELGPFGWSSASARRNDAAILLLIYSTALGAEWTVRWSGGEGLQSRPTSPAPITQAEKNKVFFLFQSQPPQCSTVT
jgi:hypothetical protein